MAEEVVVSSRALQLCQEAIETYVKGIEPKDGLGLVLSQLGELYDVDPDLWEALWYIWRGRQDVHHEKWWFRLEDPQKYVRVMYDVLRELCPNWNISHWNEGAERLQRQNADLQRQNADLVRENEYLHQQLWQADRDYECEGRESVNEGRESVNEDRESVNDRERFNDRKRVNDRGRTVGRSAKRMRSYEDDDHHYI